MKSRGRTTAKSGWKIKEARKVWGQQLSTLLRRWAYQRWQLGIHTTRPACSCPALRPRSWRRASFWAPTAALRVLWFWLSGSSQVRHPLPQRSDSENTPIDRLCIFFRSRVKIARKMTCGLSVGFVVDGLKFCNDFMGVIVSSCCGGSVHFIVQS